jgi:lysophospholipase L1-like esterase
MTRILFQGDSITDVARGREDHNNLGLGYPTLIKGYLGYEKPNDYQFINRGISGNRIVDLYARIKVDIINLKPDVLSILIGVNDVWHELSSANGVEDEKYFNVYSMLVEEIIHDLPDVHIMIMEPFVLKGSATEGQWEEFDCEVRKRAKRAKEVADKYRLIFIPLQSVFSEAEKRSPEDYLTLDGVHPTTMGHELIKREWLKAFESLNV